MSNERYSPEELASFKQHIEKKLARAQEDLAYLLEQVQSLSHNADGDHNADYIDGSSAHSDIERFNAMIALQRESIQQLEAALVRIRLGTYGVCAVTGEKIDAGRLRIVPGATRSVEGERLVQEGKAEDRDLSVAYPEDSDIDRTSDM